MRHRFSVSFVVLSALAVAAGFQQGNCAYGQAGGGVPIRAHDGSLDLELINPTPGGGAKAITSFKVPVDDQTVIKIAVAATDSLQGAIPPTAVLTLTKSWTITLSDGHNSHAVVIKGNGKKSNGNKHPVSIKLSDARDSFNTSCSHGSYCLHDGENPGQEYFGSIQVTSDGHISDFTCPDETKCALDIGFNPL